ncbi:hypothetical protein [Alkalibacterium olivapovliticus]|uniref:NADPH-dependent FMN reductase n=1 Tax=Alkalibacterium olivapovliticus TaxID=99907 RepID=A0A2T0W4A1_9LACT|nr:hypothetical protein [Alkalibacterium olivapovliticus]PRY80102.1 hypothetical protein CLV38_12238 [Alkalibacterium olivapovliticus]
MLKIGIVLLDRGKEKESMSIARKVYPYFKKAGRRARGTEFELMRTVEYTKAGERDEELTDEGRRKLDEKDGFIFVVPTFSGDVPDDYCEFFQSMSAELLNKSALVVCYGEERERKNTKQRINEVLLNYDVGLPTSDIFLPEYDFVEWKIKQVIDDYISSRLKDYILWTMGMKYMRNLKERLVM